MTKALFVPVFYFMVPIAFLILSILYSGNFDLAYDTLLGHLLIITVSDSGHIFMTIPSYISRKKNFIFGNMGIIILAICVFILNLVIFNLSTKLFLSFVAYMTMFHVARQQMGIFKKLLRKQSVFQVYSQAHVWMMRAVLGISILHWHSYASQKLPKYFSDGDIYRFFPADLLINVKYWFTIVFVAYCIYFLITFAKKLEQIYEIIFMQIGTFIWYFVGLVILDNPSLFWILTSVLHGLVYVVYTYIDQNRIQEIKNTNSASNKKKSKLYNHLVYLIPILFLMLFWDKLKVILETNAQLNSSKPVGLFLALFWIPAISHYIMDAFIWKSSVDYTKTNSVIRSS